MPTLPSEDQEKTVKKQGRERKGVNLERLLLLPKRIQRKKNQLKNQQERKLEESHRKNPL